VNPARASPTRIGVFGGTFDPPHVGHLLVVGDAAEQLKLDRVLWVPAAMQPLKPGTEASSAPADARRRMVERTIAGDPRFALEPSELDRGGLSFTVDTLAELRKKNPSADLYLLVGTDAWRTFGSWREPGRIAELAKVVVLARDDSVESPSGAHTAPDPEGVVAPIVLRTRRVDVSATEIRERVRAGKSVRGYVTEAVERYIVETGLYK
jgi:nicotinate-nucleotide adenylyltransferase